MAIDPTALADEQTQRAALAAQGAPTEFAQGPEQAVRVAGPAAEGLRALLNRLPTSVQGTRPDGQPARPPGPQETGIVEDPGGLSLRGAAEAAAPDVLSDEGQARFAAMQYRAPTPQQFAAPETGPTAPNDVLQSASEALDAQATEAATQAEDLRTGAQRALTAEDRGFGPESGVAPEGITDEVLAQLSAEELNIKSLADGGDFNFDFLTTPDSVKATITAVGEVLADPQAAVTRGIRTNEVTTQEAAKLVADEVGMTRALLSRQIGDGALNAEQMVAARELLVRSATRLTDLAQRIKSGQADAGERLAFRRQLAIHAGIQLQLKGAQTEAARALQSFRIPVSGELDAQQLTAEAQRLMREGKLDESTDALADKLLANGNLPEAERLKAVNALVERGWSSRTKAAVHEAYLAGLVSNPTTQIKNIVGTASFMMYQLPVEMVAGAVGSVIRGTRGRVDPRYLSEDQVYVQDAMLRAKGWVDSFTDAMRAASVAWRTEMPSSLATKLDIEAYEPGIVAPPKMFGMAVQGTAFGDAINNFGRMARIPFRLLLAGDEFFKTISMRGELYTAVNRRYQMSLRKGNTHEQAMDDAGMVLLDPRAVREDLDLKARYDTLTSDLGLFGRSAAAVQNTWIGRVFVPFSTAPTNEILRTAEFLMLKGAADAAGQNGPRAQQLAIARYGVGASTAITVGYLATQGKLTGSMPTDPKVRAALPPGWQPYSVVLRGEGFPTDEDGDPLPLYDRYGRPNGPLTYVNYAGYGPLTSVIGIAANATQIMMMSRDPQQRGHIGAAAVTSVVDYFQNLPMLQGLADVISLADTGSLASFMRGPSQAATALGPLVPNPASSLQRGLFRLEDPTVVRPRGDLQYFTLEEVEAGAAAGNQMFLLDDGAINYDLVGLTKGDWEEAGREAFGTMSSFMAQDSFFRDERDKNAVLYDLLGNPVGSEDANIYSRPGLAVWNALTGIRIRPGEDPSPLQDELMRLASVTNDFPLRNRETYNGLRLGFGAQSDLTNLAKNEVTLGREEVMDRVSVNFGGADFRGALDRAINSTIYVRMSDKEKAGYLRRIEDMYYERAFQLLLDEPQYANLRQAYEGIQERQRLENRGRR